MQSSQQNSKQTFDKGLEYGLDLLAKSLTDGKLRTSIVDSVLSEMPNLQKPTKQAVWTVVCIEIGIDKEVHLYNRLKFEAVGVCMCEAQASNPNHRIGLINACKCTKKDAYNYITTRNDVIISKTDKDKLIEKKSKNQYKTYVINGRYYWSGRTVNETLDYIRNEMGWNNLCKRDIMTKDNFVKKGGNPMDLVELPNRNKVNV